MPAYEFNLPVDPGGMPPVIHLAQYDTGRTYYANLKQGGDYYYLGIGVTAKIKGRNARGVCWELPCSIDTSLTYQVQFTPEGAATDQFGIMPVQMELTDSQGVISTLLMVWDIQRAGYTSEEAVTSPEFETALEAAVAAAIAQQGLGFTEEFKQALLACFNNVAWATPDGQSLVDDLETALYPEVHLTSITADYEQDRPILDTDSLDLVRLDLVATANYSDGTSETLASDAYTLTGTLTVGTSTITVEYQGKTAEIEVVVTFKMYQAVEWIETDGACRIDTGAAFDGTKDIVIELDAERNPLASTNSIMFGWNAGGATGTTGVTVPLWYDGAGSPTAETNLGGTDKMTHIEMTIQAGSASNTVTVFTNETGTKTNTRTHTNVANRTFLQNFPLFALSAQSDFSFTPEGMRIKACKISVGGVVVRNLYACYRRTDNVIGYRDDTHDLFLTNLGSGTFTKGADV